MIDSKNKESDNNKMILNKSNIFCNIYICNCNNNSILKSSNQNKNTIYNNYYNNINNFNHLNHFELDNSLNNDSNNLVNTNKKDNLNNISYKKTINCLKLNIINYFLKMIYYFKHGKGKGRTTQRIKPKVFPK